MLKKLISVAFVMFSWVSYGLSQTFDQSNGCVSDTLVNPGKVLTRIDTHPAFKGNMKRFLTNNISIDVFLRYMQPEDTLFSDTARIKFVLSKAGVISNISIGKVKNPLFQAEVLRLLRLSSCNWQIGQSGGRLVNAWVQYDIYYRIVRKNGEVKMNLDYKQFDPPEMSM